MPRNSQIVSHLENVPLAERAELPSSGQEHWYHLAGSLIADQTVLDVGASNGTGIDILRQYKPKSVIGIDPAGGTIRPDVTNHCISSFKDNSVDIITCFDVIEHIEQDVIFLQHLWRVAKKSVILSTPCYEAWGCKNPFHVREYSHDEFGYLLSTLASPEGMWLWTCSKNRAISTAKPIESINQAIAQYFVVISKDTAMPVKIEELHHSMRNDNGAAIFDKISYDTRTAEEWVAFFTNRVKGLSTPLAIKSLASWAQTHLKIIKLDNDNSNPKIKYDCINIIRSGKATEAQELIVLSWLINKFVLIPKGSITFIVDPVVFWKW